MKRLLSQLTNEMRAKHYPWHQQPHYDDENNGSQEYDDVLSEVAAGVSFVTRSSSNHQSQPMVTERKQEDKEDQVDCSVPTTTKSNVQQDDDSSTGQASFFDTEEKEAGSMRSQVEELRQKQIQVLEEIKSFELDLDLPSSAGVSICQVASDKVSIMNIKDTSHEKSSKQVRSLEAVITPDVVPLGPSRLDPFNFMATAERKLASQRATENLPKENISKRTPNESPSLHLTLSEGPISSASSVSSSRKSEKTSLSLTTSKLRSKHVENVNKVPVRDQPTHVSGRIRSDQLRKRSRYVISRESFQQILTFLPFE